MDTKMSKSVIRHEVKQVKHMTPSIMRQKWENAIFKQVEELACFVEAQSILLYYSLPDEVSTKEFIAKWSKIKKLYLPVVAGSDLLVKPYDENLSVGAFGVLEPQGEASDISQIDLVIVPGMAFDKNKNRLGRGKGYYDRLLKEITGTKIGICFSYQLQNELPVEAHDVPMDIIVTPNDMIV